MPSHPPEPTRKPAEDTFGCEDGRMCFFCRTAWAGICRICPFSHREVEILQCFILDYNERDVAEFLGMSHSTVRTHLKRIREKLGAHRRAAIVSRLHEIHLDWLSTSSPPLGCRLNGRLVPTE